MNLKSLIYFLLHQTNNAFYKIVRKMTMDIILNKIVFHVWQKDLKIYNLESRPTMGQFIIIKNARK